MGLNHQRVGLQPTALPIELPIHMVEREGVEPTKPIGRLDYSQVISPVKASPIGLGSRRLKVCMIPNWG